mgnify:CR=1 FL=1
MCCIGVRPHYQIKVKDNDKYIFLLFGMQKKEGLLGRLSRISKSNYQQMSLLYSHLYNTQSRYLQKSFLCS